MQPAIETLLVLTVQTRVMRSVARTPLGDRTVVDVVGGSFEGPGLSGRVCATGGDWLIRTPGRSRIDVRLLLETVDGTGILLQYSGRAHQVDDQPRIEVSGTFDAPEGSYDWLNDIQAFGLGEPLADGVRYHFYRFG
jgi:hypothetical protein